MGNTPPWNPLSAQDRATCTGELRDLRCCGRLAWNVEGRLQEDWNKRIQPTINRLIYQNYKLVFGKRGVQALLSFHLYLLSSTQDPATAVPTIFILTDKKEVAFEAKRLITRHEIYKQLNTGFDVLHEYKTIFMIVGQSGTEKSNQLVNNKSLCGARVVIKSALDQDEERLQYATIFCTVRIGQRFFAILPAHVFFPPDDHDAYSDTSSEDVDTPPSESSEESAMLHAAAVTDNAQHAFTSMAQNQQAPTISDIYVYLDRPHLSSSVRTEDLLLLGQFHPQNHHFLPSRMSAYNRELDYVLLEIQDSTLVRQNYVVTPLGQRVDARKVETGLRSGAVLIAAGSFGVRNTSISGTAVTLVFPGSSGPRTVRELGHALPAGDSGSPVITHDGGLVGMVIAAVPEHGISYLMPASDILTAIATSQNQWLPIGHCMDEFTESRAQMLLNIHLRPADLEHLPIEDLENTRESLGSSEPDVPESSQEATTGVYASTEATLPFVRIANTQPKQDVVVFGKAPETLVVTTPPSSGLHRVNIGRSIGNPHDEVSDATNRAREHAKLTRPAEQNYKAPETLVEQCTSAETRLQDLQQKLFEIAKQEEASRKHSERLARELRDLRLEHDSTIRERDELRYGLARASAMPDPIEDRGKAAIDGSFVKMSGTDTQTDCESLQEDESYIIRCICRQTRDDGSTVYCPKCNTWQHIRCYYGWQEVPDVHICQVCQTTEAVRTKTQQQLLDDRHPDEAWMTDNSVSRQKPDNSIRHKADLDSEFSALQHHHAQTWGETQAWARIHRKHILPETLNYYRLKWHFDQDDDDYVVIEEHLDHESQRDLFAHTKRILSSRRRITLDVNEKEIPIPSKRREKRPESTWILDDY